MYRNIQERQVTRPSVTPLKSTVLDHATVEVLDDHYALVNNTGLWPSYNCLDTLNSTALCPDPTEDKVFDFVGWVPGFSFAVYAGTQCNLVGLDLADQKSETKRVFLANEGKGVERALLANRFVVRGEGSGMVDLDTGLEIPRSSDGRGIATWEAPVDLTGAVTADPAVAFSVLEGYARTVYAGQPTLHLPAGAVSFLGADKIVWEGDKAYTRLGSKVALGGGYDPDYVGWNGEWTFYATGEVYVEKGPEIDIQTYELNGTSGGYFDANTGLTLAERPYRAAVDCFAAQVRCTVTGE